MGGFLRNLFQKTEKITERIKPKVPANSGVRQRMTGGIRIAATNTIRTYFLTIKKSFFIRKLQ